jgi:hypothetical protein
LTGQRFYYRQAVALGQRLFIFGIREDENWRLVFLIFITPRFFAAGEKRNVATTGWLVM